jgi:5-methylcytosine-specific restriction protein A
MPRRGGWGRIQAARSLISCADAEWFRHRLRPEVRALVWSRYSECFACGTEQSLTLDHVIPLTRGGDNDPSNFQVLCRRCNSRKANMTPKEWLASEKARGRWPDDYMEGLL